MIPFIFPSDHTALLHTICNPETGDALYPDILFSHEYPEEALLDSKAYQTALELAKERSLSEYVFFVATESHTDAIKAFVQALSISEAFISTNNEQSDGSETILRFCEDLRLSVSLQRSFLQLMDYYQTVGGDVSALLTPFYEEYNLPVKTKKEGITLYEHIRNIILG